MFFQIQNWNQLNMAKMGFYVLRFLLILTLGYWVNATSHAQAYDLLIQGGHVFDARNQLDGVLDIAIVDDRISRIAPALDPDQAKKVIDASGLWVCPGLIDIHTHVFVGNKAGKFADGINSISPDDFSFRAGITTVVDAGTSGWRNFPQFKKQVIDQSKTRILAFLNIAGVGMSGDERQEHLDEMQVEKVVDRINEYADILVGVKIGHYNGDSWMPFDRALEACTRAQVPLLVECHLPQYSLEDQLARMRPGDIITHSYEKVSERMSVIDEQGNVRPFVREAKDRGILFDVGHGGAGFWFSEAIPALEQGLWPNSFGTDMHRFSINKGMKDMLNVMSKYLAMGMPLKQIFARATWYPAKSIGREDLGHLKEGSTADITLIRVIDGQFGYVDAGGNRIEGNKKLEAEVTIRAGKVVWDLNGMTARPYPD